MDGVVWLSSGCKLTNHSLNVLISISKLHLKILVSTIDQYHPITTLRKLDTNPKIPSLRVLLSFSQHNLPTLWFRLIRQRSSSVRLQFAGRVTGSIH
jgi:hypothetical protein